MWYIVVRFFKEFFGQLFMTLYFGLHLGRGCFLSYKQLGIDVVTLVVFVILAIVYLVKTLWFAKSYEDKRSRRLYLLITIIMHVVFNVWFVAHYLYFKNAWLLAAEILVYWLAEAVICLWFHKKP